MKALTKKLLSWLCVMAMVLSLVPAVALPASATETEAIQYGAAYIPADQQEAVAAAKAEAARIQGEDLAAHIAAGSCPICGEGVTWLNYNTPGKVTSGSKHFVVTDETVPGSEGQWCAITGGTGTNVCLALMNTQPKTIGGSIGFRDQSSTSGCTFNVMGSGTLIGSGTVGAASYGLIFVDGADNVVNLYGGTFIYTGTGLTSAGKVRGGAITFYEFANNSTLNIFDGVNIGPETQDTTTQCYNVVMRGHGSTSSRKTFINMYGGTIRNGVSKASNIGGNVQVNVGQTGQCTFNMYGGTIKNGTYHADVTSNRNGGNVNAQQRGYFNMYGGTVTGGKATNGGNIYTPEYSNPIVRLYGGIVENGEATDGGNIQANSRLYISNTALIRNGKASNTGGNIYHGSNAEYRFLDMSGGKVAGGEATYSGGNLYMKTSAAGYSKITSGVLDGATAGSHGGNIYLGNANITISGATISGGVSAKCGGNIYVDTGAVTLDNVTVSNGVATENGGNIYANTGTLNVNATISGGSAENGGSIYVVNETTNITGGTITGGVATGNGGNIYHTTKDTALNISNVTVSGGKATFGGNLSQHMGDVSITDATFENGEATTAGGNINAQGGTLDMTDTVLTGGKTNGNGSNLRVYNITLNMNGGSISGGVDNAGAPTNNVYLVRGTLSMSGDATVTGDNTYGSAIRATTHTWETSTVRSRVVLADTASILGGNTALALETADHADGETGPVDCTLRIVDGWNGTASVWTADSYTYGDTVAEDNIIIGTYAEDGTFVKGGTFTGTLQAVGLKAKAEESNVVLAPAGIILEDGTRTSYWSNDEALADYAYSENSYAVLTGATATIPETVSQLNVEILGREITFSGNAKIYGSDSANDSYNANGKIIVAEGSQITVEPVVIRNEKRYVALQDETGAWTFHRLRIFLDTVTLRTEGNPGIYYKAAYYCDEALRDLVDSYGVALSVIDMPGADFETSDKYTAYTGEDFAAAYAENKVRTVSGAVTGIMKERNSQERNTANAQVEIYANPYLKLNIGEESLLIMANGEEAYSLFEVLEGVNKNWDNYSAEEQLTIAAFIEKWAPQVTQEAAALLQSTLTNIFPAA